MRITDEELCGMVIDAATDAFHRDGGTLAERRRAFAAAVAKDILNIVWSQATDGEMAKRIEADIKERYGVE